METVSEQIITRSEILPIRTQIDLVHVRQRVRTWLSEARFTLIDQTKIVTASSERIDFRTPIHAGEIIEAIARVIYGGRTSMIVRIHIYAEHPLSGARRKS